MSMGVTVDWYDETKTIVHYQFKDKWTWDEFYVCWEWVRNAMETSAQKVAVITDLSGSLYIPPNPLLHLRALVQQHHPNYAGVTVYVGAGRLGSIYSIVLEQLDPTLRSKHKAFFA